MKKLLASTIFMLLLAVQLYAAPINSPVPSNAYITFSGLDWAWGGPCPYSGGCYATGDLSYQGTLGWALPTSAQLALIPTNFASYFITGSGNVPYNGTDPLTGAFFAAGPVVPALSGSCATPYFATTTTWCDWVNGASGDWAGVPGSDYFAEQLYVRTAVPEPTSLALLGSGLLGLGALRRRFLR